MNGKLAIQAVAKKRGVSEKVIRHEIERAIADAWAASTGETARFQRTVPCRGKLPTPEELIEFLYTKMV